MSLYHDSSQPDRPSLVGDLLAVPSWERHHQFENQATTVLAWLVDNSPAVAYSVLELFLGEHVPAEAKAKGAVSSRTQLSLEGPGGERKRPDLSIRVGGRALQLLVEVKVAAKLAEDQESRELQHEGYRRLLRDRGDTRMRAVGTLTREGGSETRPDPDNLVARDVCWRDLREKLNDVRAEPCVRLVARAFVDAIDDRIAPKPPTDEEFKSFRAMHGKLPGRVAHELARLIHCVPRSASPSRKDWWIGSRIPLPEPYSDLSLLIYVSPKGAPVIASGWRGDALTARLEKNHPHKSARPEVFNADPVAAAAAETAGFKRIPDFRRWTHRRDWELESAADETEEIAKEIAESLRKMFTTLSATSAQ